MTLIRPICPHEGHCDTREARIQALCLQKRGPRLSACDMPPPTPAEWDSWVDVNVGTHHSGRQVSES